MNRLKVASLASTAGVVMALAFSSPAAAFEVIQQSGQTGDHGVRSNGPEAKCFYSGPTNPAGILLKSMKVWPMLAGPATGNSQKVSLTISIQKSTDGGGTWKTIKTAKTQTGTATSTASPDFKAVTFSIASKPTAFYRAISTLKWLTNGTQSGLLKVRMTDYGVKVGKANNAVDASDWCSGQLFD